MNKRSDYKASLLLMIQTCLISQLFFPSTALAYVDPGSGSVIVTTVLGLIAAVGYTVRKYFYKIRNLFAHKKTEQEHQDSE
jgi:hypothetical protein